MEPKPPPPRSNYTGPSTSDLMHGVAPSAPSNLHQQVRDVMGIPPRTPASDAGSMLSEAEGSRVPSLVRSPIPMRMSPAPSPSFRRGTVSDIARSSPKPPSPPIARQTPRLPTIDVPASSYRASAPKSVRSVSGGSGARKISVREITRDGTDVDAQSIAAMSYVSRKPKTARIFEVAEVINGTAPGSPEGGAAGIGKTPGTGSLTAIEQWALGHSTRFDMIEEKLQELKAEILANKPAKRRYFSA